MFAIRLECRGRLKYYGRLECYEKGNPFPLFCYNLLEIRRQSCWLTHWRKPPSGGA